MRHLLATARISGRGQLGRRAAALSSVGSTSMRRYTNTSVYTRADAMTPEEHLQVLLAEQRYLIELLKTDDSQAPWSRDSIVTVSREVQQGFPEPHHHWLPDQGLPPLA
ncbi:hypothetical protein GGI04_003100 [Coemansia thaxteri]|uniref:Uncharacterized protein n=1 Tax=Coemansia thaxteri TaxID=2663907 RepID=A0A9W8BHK7_9FUNG|nr:hypothetical protein GGI04_003100 [Coemansia thaxteri]KAJ2007313.1 hypothetical protein H4R26_000844 [Coemansia thaxteri]KAJ2470428.1 hypothetical protein GGI02_002932 [Coemansia sp. RSA 2322]KAJ2474968.1 hypothetical protein EV174_005447 [Coemansia sp. RSA 2320]